MEQKDSQHAAGKAVNIWAVIAAGLIILGILPGTPLAFAALGLVIGVAAGAKGMYNVAQKKKRTRDRVIFFAVAYLPAGAFALLGIMEIQSARAMAPGRDALERAVYGGLGVLIGLGLAVAATVALIAHIIASRRKKKRDEQKLTNTPET